MESAMTIELPEQLEAALRAHATAHGLSADMYVREVIERELAPELNLPVPGKPFKTGRGMWAKYGVSLSAEEIDANRADMFRGFGDER
jgi:plasmid stability protein